MSQDQLPGQRRPQLKSLRAPSPVTSAVRNQQMAAINRHLATTGAQSPTLVAGDFNYGDAHPQNWPGEQPWRKT